MITSKEVYVIYGAKIDPALVTDEIFEKLLENKLTFPYNGVGALGKCGVLHDVISGKYCVAGLCLGLDSESDSMFLEIDKITLKEYFNNVDDFFIDSLDDIFPNLDRKFSVFAVTHYH